MAEKVPIGFSRFCVKILVNVHSNLFTTTVRLLCTVGRYSEVVVNTGLTVFAYNFCAIQQHQHNI